MFRLRTPVRARPSAVQTARLAVHGRGEGGENFAERGAVFEHLPRLIGVVVDLDELIITDGVQAVTLEVRASILADGVLVQTRAFNEKLGIVAIVDHAKNPFCNDLPVLAEEKQRERAGAGVRADHRSDDHDLLDGSAVAFLEDRGERVGVRAAVAVRNEHRSAGFVKSKLAVLIGHCVE